jgi:hypothetical protein
VRLTAATFDFGPRFGKVTFNLSGVRKAIVKRNGVETVLAGFDVARPSVARAQRALYDGYGVVALADTISWCQFRFTGINNTNPRIVNYDFVARRAEIYTEFEKADSPFVVPFGPHEPLASYRAAISLLTKRLKDEI